MTGLRPLRRALRTAAAGIAPFLLAGCLDAEPDWRAQLPETTAPSIVELVAQLRKEGAHPDLARKFERAGPAVIPALAAFGAAYHEWFDEPRWVGGAVGLIAAQGRGGLRNLRRVLARGSRHEREIAARAVRFGAEGDDRAVYVELIPDLLASLEDPTMAPGNAGYALAALIPESVDPMLEWAADKDEDVRGSVRGVFGLLGWWELEGKPELAEVVLARIERAMASEDAALAAFAFTVHGPAIPRK